MMNWNKSISKIGGVNRWCLAVVLLLLAKVTFCQDEQEIYAFSYFKGNGEDGLHLAYSEDGYQWTALKDDQSFLKPVLSKDKLMRDPCIIRGGDGKFHMVWTVSWTDKGIGYASSSDLIHWSEQQYIPVMAHEEEARNCWAPEITFDTSTKKYMIYWATTIKGKFPETQVKGDDAYNHRIYYVTTKDFKTFSKTKLLYEPGFNVIDASIVKEGKQWLMLLKDETKEPAQKNIKIAYAKNLEGPYAEASKPITGKFWAEGPTVTKIGADWVVYFDKYTEHKYGAIKSSNLQQWEDVSDKIKLPEGIRHGSIFKISKQQLTKLLAQSAPQAALPGVYADPHIAYFDHKFYIYPTTDGSEGWQSDQFSCWSSTDLKKWKNEGTILDLKKDLSWANVRAWAPAIAYKGGKYFYYFSADVNIGVAVSDKPSGPFKDPLGKPLVAKGEYPGQMIDPMVLVDDDGSAYLYWGQGNCYVVKLNEDMVSFDPKNVKQFKPEGYNEGPFAFKRNGKYYLMWSEYDTRDPRYSVAYALSDSPLGPFVKVQQNPILKGKGIVKGAGHHAVVHVPETDQWFIAYHRFKIPGGNGYNRETCISPMYFDAAGNITEVDVYEAGMK
ncbi:family 43 glycosylhydrolase [Olivibacter domesticus]|nr:family 43 glycosylhydrolase [Olivibacter domesticus]